MNDPRREAPPLFLRPLSQQYLGYTAPEAISSEQSSMYVNSIIVQFAAPQQDAEATLRRTLAAIDPNLTIFYFASYDAQVENNFTQDRLIACLTTLFSILALTLASVGLYGVIAFFVARRTGEIGIRMAMGAARSRIVWMVLRSVAVPILVGAVLGVPGALYAGHLAAGLLYRVSAESPWAWLGAMMTLAVCAAVAGIIPARRAAAINPIDALRIE